MVKNGFAVSFLALSLALAGTPASAQLFGPSDEEKAHEASQDSQLSDLNRDGQQMQNRIRNLEDKVRSLTDSLSQATGANEDLGHQIQVQNDKIDRMQKDFNYRLCTVSAQQLGAGAGDQGLNCASAGGGGMPPSGYGAPGGPRALQPGDSLPPLGAGGGGANGGGFSGGNGDYTQAPPQGNSQIRGRAPGTLGSMPAGPGGGAVPPRGGDTSQYDTAMNLLTRAQYDDASAAFRAYADANPDDTDLSPQAIFWIGNIASTRQDYPTAARAFAEVIKKYPKSSRAPDAMLKLSQSFMSMGQKSEGCTTLGLIKTKYPNASDTTLAQSARLRKTACK